jgi:hypothetical protein
MGPKGIGERKGIGSGVTDENAHENRGAIMKAVDRLMTDDGCAMRNGYWFLGEREF